MNTERTRQERLQKWINLKEEELKQRLAKRNGISIGRAVGSSLMNPTGSAAPDDSPDGQAQTQDGEKEKLTEKLELGDELEDFELYDCDTGEKVTLDGLGGGDAEPKYPIGFENCEAAKKPTMADLADKTIYKTVYFRYQGITDTTYALDTSDFEAARARANAECQQYASSQESEIYDYIAETVVSNATYENVTVIRYPKGQTTGGVLVFQRTAQLTTSTSTEDKQAYIDNFVTPVWPDADKNHLKLGDDNCFGALCPEHNNQVSPKYQGCQDELILCDENGKKNKITVNDDGTVDVLQGDFNQVSTIKNGKVVAVKKLTESQKEREFA